MSMQKQSLTQKSVYWLKVISLGLILGLGIQFAEAWTPPAVAPPGGNVSGPITTSSTAQTKNGDLTINGTLATNAFYIGTKDLFVNNSSVGWLTHKYQGSYYNSAIETGYLQANTVLNAPQICLGNPRICRFD